MRYELDKLERKRLNALEKLTGLTIIEIKNLRYKENKTEFENKVFLHFSLIMACGALQSFQDDLDKEFCFLQSLKETEVKKMLEEKA